MYKKICEMYMLIIDTMRGDRYKIPANELTKCSIMQKTVPEFIHIMTSQMNLFISQRATEFSKNGE
jgi:hypothetical protein